jgi:carbamoyltransferase
LIVDGELVLAINEERLSRRKLEICFPRRSIDACLKLSGTPAEAINVVACCTSDVAKTIGRWWPSSKESYYQIRRRKASPTWATRIKKREKYRITEWGSNAVSLRLSKVALVRALRPLGLSNATLRLFDHHRCHAATAAFGSGLDPCVIVTIDGVGDGLSATVSCFRDGRLERLATSSARNSLGVFFEHATNLLNMRELEDEGKVMALADYTLPIEENPCLDVIWVEGLSFKTAVPGHAMIDVLRRIQWSYPNEQFAYLVQSAVEIRMADLCRAAVEATGFRKIALAGGVASNVKGNRRIRLLPEVDEVFVFPHMGDGGLAVGAGWLAAAEAGDTPRWGSHDLGLGPNFSEDVMQRCLLAARLCSRRPTNLASEAASILAAGKIVLWFQGRMEYGPRALGYRSVLARPDRPAIRDRLNLVLKRRAWFQPFCPSMLEGDAAALLADFNGRPNRFMTMAYRVHDEHCAKLSGVISLARTCRPQVVPDTAEGLFADLLRACRRELGIGAVLNTSFNMHGEPLVCTPDEAIDVYRRSGADVLVLGPHVVEREQ